MENINIELLKAIEVILKREVQPIKTELQSVKSELQSVKIQLDENTQILKALELRHLQKNNQPIC